MSRATTFTTDPASLEGNLGPAVAARCQNDLPPTLSARSAAFHFFTHFQPFLRDGRPPIETLPSGRPTYQLRRRNGLTT